jgi:putative sterol carrier protein
VPGIGSDAWVAALDARCRALPPAAGAPFVVQQSVGDAAWHPVVDGTGVRAVRGRHPSPDLTIEQDEATAEAVEAGELSAQRAFLDGRLRITGDVKRLPEVAAVVGA